MPDTLDHTMSAAEFRVALIKCGFADPDNRPGDEGISEAGRFFGAGARTARAWAKDGPPAAVTLMLRYMLAEKLTPEDVLGAIRGRRRR